MTKARKHQISLEATPYYHVISRCVRHAFLCGQDKFTGRCFEHRRSWIESDLKQLSTVFFIDIAAYAIMSNHFHLVLHVDQSAAQRADTHEIIERWHRRFGGSVASQKYINKETLEPHEKDLLNVQVELWRGRLFNISWLMRTLNETTARKANKEDECTGRFWEGRFKSIPLLDNQALLSCMAYVDLNPIRASVALSPETSAHTSIKQRALSFAGDSTDAGGAQPSYLMPLIGARLQPEVTGIAFNVADYLELVDWTGRQIREKPSGRIQSDAPPILGRLNITPQHWIYLSTQFENRFKGLVGTAESLKRSFKQFGLTRRPNLNTSYCCLAETGFTFSIE